jgi:large subunit ribosomal protein L9
MDAAGFKVERSQVALNQPIKSIGLHTVAIVLHPEVEASVTVNVARSEDEAARQARGEDLTVAAAEPAEEPAEAEPAEGEEAEAESE